jgi:hypothetical protein
MLSYKQIAKQNIASKQMLAIINHLVILYDFSFVP